MLNYRQLHHFWNVAKAGGITRAANRTGLTPQTLSGQIGALEADLGAMLFRRVGKRMELTDTGQLVLGYAEEIFQLGNELEEVVRNRNPNVGIPFRVGIADVVPKAIAYLLLAPAIRQEQPVRMVCREDKLDRLLGELAVHRLDVVLADSPMPPNTDVRGTSHLLRQSGVGFFAVTSIAEALRGPFPNCLDQAPLLIPGSDAAVRGRLMRWFENRRLRPRIVGEFDDTALMKAFGQAGVGIIVTSSDLSSEIEEQFGVREIGRTEDVIEEVYAITVPRRLAHPAVQAICAS
jgi:LysR family transcriptional activator of nhaA